MKNTEIIAVIKNKIGNIGIDKIFFVLLVGILLIVISLPTKQSKSIISDNNLDENTEYEKYLENKLEKHLSDVKGLGKTEVMVKLKTDDKGKITKTIEGVIVIAQNVDDNNVKLEVIEGLSALLGIQSHKIKILEMEGK